MFASSQLSNDFWRNYCQRSLIWRHRDNFDQFLFTFLPRATLENRDVWNNLESNWNDFFWLTGETPITLNELVQEMQNKFHPTFRRRRLGSLDFRNQVIHETLQSLQLFRLPNIKHFNIYNLFHSDSTMYDLAMKISYNAPYFNALWHYCKLCAQDHSWQY